MSTEGAAGPAPVFPVDGALPFIQERLLLEAGLPVPTGVVASAGRAEAEVPGLLNANSGFGVKAAAPLAKGTVFGLAKEAPAIVFAGIGFSAEDIGVGGAAKLDGAIGIGRAGIGGAGVGLIATGVGAGWRTTGSGVVTGAGGLGASAALTGAGFGASAAGVLTSGLGCGLVAVVCCGERDALACEGVVSPCLVRTGNSLLCTPCALALVVATLVVAVFLTWCVGVWVTNSISVTCVRGGAGINKKTDNNSKAPISAKCAR